MDKFNGIPASSSAGTSVIPTKVLKETFDHIAPTILDIVNTSITTNETPLAFTFAQCTPIFKKGKAVDMNNYRGISVLPPLAKLFEKLRHNI